MSILQIALDVPLPRMFDYRLEGAVSAGAAGRLAKVPFGSGSKVGVVLEVVEHSDQPAERLKTAELITGLPALPADWIELCEFCARYYHHPLGQVMAFALPPLLRKGKLPRALKPKVVADGTAPHVPTATPDQESAIAAITAVQEFRT